MIKEDWSECSFGDLLDYEQPTKYIVSSTEYNDKYITPVLTAGKTFIKGYTNETEGIFDKLPTIIFDDFTTASQFVNFKFKVKSSAMKILVPTSKLVNMLFVYYAMQVNQVRSDTHKRYWISVFAKKKFKIPPLLEQHAIVNKIEELFSSLDSGIADLKRAQDQLKIYRQAVLKKAFEGEWEHFNLGNLIVKGPTNGMYKPKSFYGSGIPILRIDGFYDGKVNSLSSLKRLELDEAELAMYSLQNDDVVVNRVNSMPYVGKSALIKNLTGDCVFESNIMRFRVDKERIFPAFLVNFLISPKGFSELQKNVKHAVNQSSINQTDVKNAIIPVPPLKEQHQIVQGIESRLSVCDAVEQSITESLDKAQALRQSILKKAFEGKLLSEEEIAKCKADKDYEPASVLLEKMKTEKKKK